MTKLIEVRCPYPVETKLRGTFVCNFLIVKAYAGSAGEGYCSKCRKPVEFEILDDQRFEVNGERKIKLQST